MKDWFIIALVLAVVIMLLLSTKEDNPASSKSSHAVEYKEQCIDGVTYVFSKSTAIHQGYGYMSAKFNPDSTVQTCNQ